MRNILDKLSRDAQVEIKRRVRDVLYAPWRRLKNEQPRFLKTTTSRIQRR